jgi:voltage-gated potassium channel
MRRAVPALIVERVLANENAPVAVDRAGVGRAIAGTVLRSGASVVVLLVLYYAAPLDRPLTIATGLVFGAALLLFGLTVAFEVRGILGSDRPKLRAIRALAVGVPLLLVVFASTYCTVAAQQTGAFSEPLSRTDGLYFTVTVFATVGFGDISAVTELARILVTVQMVVGLITVGIIAKVVLGAVRVAESRRSRELHHQGVSPADTL